MKTAAFSLLVSAGLAAAAECPTVTDWTICSTCVQIQIETTSTVYAPCGCTVTHETATWPCGGDLCAPETVQAAGTQWVTASELCGTIQPVETLTEIPPAPFPSEIPPVPLPSPIGEERKRKRRGLPPSIPASLTATPAGYPSEIPPVPLPSPIGEEKRQEQYATMPADCLTVTHTTTAPGCTPTAYDGSGCMGLERRCIQDEVLAVPCSCQAWPIPTVTVEAACECPKGCTTETVLAKSPCQTA